MVKVGPIWDPRPVPDTGSVWQKKANVAEKCTVERGFGMMTVDYVDAHGQSRVQGKVAFYEEWEPSK